MRHQQTANEKANHRNERGQLRICQTTDGVPRGAATGVARTETDEKTTNNHENETAGREQISKVENIFLYEFNNGFSQIL